MRGMGRVMGLMRLMRLMGLIGPLGLMRALGALGLLGALGCSGDSQEEEAPQPTTETAIAFASQLENEQTVTRAANLSTVTDNFRVWGFKDMESGSQMVFPGYVVRWSNASAYTSSTNSSNWDYILPTLPNQTIKYWDWSAQAYRFFAVAETSSFNKPIGSQTADAYHVTFNANCKTAADIEDTPYLSRLWYSTGNPTDYPDRQFGQPVQLEFLRPFCKVRFLFTFQDPTKADETTLSDKSFRPTDGDIIEQWSEMTVSYPLTGTNPTETVSLSGAPGGISAFTEDNTEYTVLPATNQGSFTLTVSVDGQSQTATVPSNFLDWHIGYIYTYIFKVRTDGGVELGSVQSAFTSWKEHNENYNIFNW